jgi:hypothetical protein
MIEENWAGYITVWIIHNTPLSLKYCTNCFKLRNVFTEILYKTCASALCLPFTFIIFNRCQIPISRHRLLITKYQIYYVEYNTVFKILWPNMKLF